MGTGIVSIALSLDRQETLSRILLAVAATTWIALGVLLARRALRDRERVHGDHWITGGALAISTLAAGRITRAAKALHQFGGVAGTLKVVALVLWALTIAWLPVLLAAEAIRPRLRYDVRRWSTVFPLGMYAACSFVVGALATAAAITDFARVWVWVSAAVWGVVFAAMLRRGFQLVRVEAPPLSRGFR